MGSRSTSLMQNHVRLRDDRCDGVQTPRHPRGAVPIHLRVWRRRKPVGEELILIRASQGADGEGAAGAANGVAARDERETRRDRPYARGEPLYMAALIADGVEVGNSPPTPKQHASQRDLLAVPVRHDHLEGSRLGGPRARPWPSMGQSQYPRIHCESGVETDSPGFFRSPLAEANSPPSPPAPDPESLRWSLHHPCWPSSSFSPSITHPPSNTQFPSAMSRLRRAFMSQPIVEPVAPVNQKLTPQQKKDRENDRYWQDIDEFDGKGKGRHVEQLWGLENFGNTCYCNSVMQALYHCEPFRSFVDSYPDPLPPVSPLGPAPGSANQPLPMSERITINTVPGSPIASTAPNPFEKLNGAPASPKVEKEGKSRWGGLGRKQSTSGVAPPIPKEPPRPPTPPIEVNLAETPWYVPPKPEQPPPTVFETVQTLFHHLDTSMPHQPLPPIKPPPNSNAQTAQTASLLPANGVSPSLTTSSSPNSNQPQGPPLLASLPPPSAPRGGGPYAAGSLGKGVVRLDDLLKTVKRENEMFRGMSQQDAHEFLGWLLNQIAEEIEMKDRSLRAAGQEVTEAKGLGKTFVQNLFEGVLTNETRCLSCEMVSSPLGLHLPQTSSRDELFLDLSIDIEQHTSVTACLRQFSASEMLFQKNKFFCDSCCGLQEAEKR